MRRVPQVEYRTGRGSTDEGHVPEELDTPRRSFRPANAMGRGAVARGRSAGEQQDLAGRMRPRSRRSSGAVEDAGDVGGGGDDVDDAHPAAALATEGHVDGEDAGEEIGPAKAAGSRRRLGRVVGAVVHGASEAERELLPGRRPAGWLAGWTPATGGRCGPCRASSRRFLGQNSRRLTRSGRWRLDG